MSNSDFDSDGFESAEDDEFELQESPPMDNSDPKPLEKPNETDAECKDTAQIAENSKQSIKTLEQPATQPAKSVESSKQHSDATEQPQESKTTNAQDGWDDDDGDWGWNDDNDPIETSQSNAPSTTTKSAEKAIKVEDKFKTLDVQDDWNDDDDNWGWTDDNDGNNSKFNAKPKVSELPKSSDQSAEKPFASALDALQNNSAAGAENASAWSPWTGMVSFLSTASTNVASFTSHVSSVIESNIGVPDPESFAQQQAKEKSTAPTPTSQPSSASDSDGNGDGSGAATTPNDTKSLNDEKLLNLGSFVSNVTSISNRVISGGLDTLEGIGKKTMTILQENDAGLISKRRLLGLDNPKPVLSQVLREAKEKSEEMEKTMNLSQKRSFRKQLHFETLFDDFHGLVHLEALEMLSKQASMKLQTLLMPLTGNALNELQQTMDSVNELCELNEADLDETPSLLYDATELDEKLKAAVEDFDVPMDFTDILE